MTAPGPLAGLKVVEAAPGCSQLGLGLAIGLPGMILADLGAEVWRIDDPDAPGIDRDLTWPRAWHRAKKVIPVQDPDAVATALAEADILLGYGDRHRLLAAGVDVAALTSANPGLIIACCQPDPETGDYALLVEARAGFCAQLAGHREGPIFVDTRTTGAGAGLIMTAGVLALLCRREATGIGGRIDTSLYDGMLATIGTMIGRTEHAPERIESYWRDGNTFPNFMFRCSDGELLQFWFGGKGMYEAVIAALGDEPSEQGYYADQMAGRLGERAARWQATLATRPRVEWIAELRRAGIPCEPVLRPGEALADPHLDAIGLAVDQGGDRMVGSAVAVTTVAGTPALAPVAAEPDRPLAGIRVVDFSAFLAAPLGAQILADLGADVIKVEPPKGEAMRAAAYAVAACQRGKRSLAIDLTDPAAQPVLERLIAGADVVLHNVRHDSARRLGLDAASVARINPQAIHCHFSAFGPAGPRMAMPGNDGLMQALTGFERAIGGEGNDPIAATWIPIDITGGWLGAIAMLAGLYARGRTGLGQVVTTCLLGAGMLLQSGIWQREGTLQCGPSLDSGQTGYGPGHRLYRCGDDVWIAVVIPQAEAWTALAAVAGVDELPVDFLPLRQDSEASPSKAEQVLADFFATAPAAEWPARLGQLGVLCEVVAAPDRDGFRRSLLDDPSNQALGRVLSYEAFDWGRIDQIGRLMRFDGKASSKAPGWLPAIGGHSAVILAELGFDDTAIAKLIERGVVTDGQ